MSVPRKVKVGSFFFDVYADKKNFDRICGDFALDENVFLRGLTDCMSTEIGINPSILNQNQKDTVMHEVFHAAWYACHLDQLVVDPDMEEYVVALLSTMVLGILQENPKLVAYLLER